MKKLRLFSVVVLSVLWSCADLGAEDPGGTGGTVGTGGTSGTGGTGGADAMTTLERNTEPVPDPPQPLFAAEPTDEVDAANLSADGSVVGDCDGEGLCSGTDPVDQFILRAGPAGAYTIDLSWLVIGGSDVDLDLFFVDATGSTIIAQSVQVGTSPESVSPTLTAGETYLIQVQAFDTKGLIQDYTLSISEP